jgi:hypothetical protein
MVEFISFLAALVLVAFSVASLVALNSTSRLEVNAIERGYALYCPLDGEWAWKGECDG